MFEIGNSLREARLRQGIEFVRAENETKIRSKYLQALEGERFEVLPGETYVKGFLRTYAEYLGLDGQLYVDEFNSRFAHGEEPVAVAAPPRRSRGRASESNFVVVALAGIVAVTILVVVAFAFGDDAQDEPTLPAATTQAADADESSGSGGTKTHKPGAPKTARLLLAADGGDCWVEVRRNGPTGELLFSGTMFDGDKERFAGKRLWVMLGAAENVVAKLNGKAVATWPDGQAAVLVTPRGAKPQRTT